MGLRPLMQEDVSEDLYRCVVKGCADDATRDLCSKGFLSGRKYLSYFALLSVTDSEPTLRIAFVTSNDTVRKKTLVLGEHAAYRLFRDPSKLDEIVKESKARRVVACFSEPDGCEDVAYTLEKLQGLFYAVKSAEFYDMVLIDGGELHSLIRVYKDDHIF